MLLNGLIHRPTTRASARILQRLPGWNQGDQADPNGNRRSVSILGEEPIREMGAPLREPPDGGDDESRRNKVVEQSFRDAQPNQVVAILKAREPARIRIIGSTSNAG